MTDEKRLAELIARVIDSRSAQSRISPGWIATEVMKDLDPERTAPELVYVGCHLQLRQIARSQLRGRYDGETGASEQHELWPDLQARYPVMKSGEEPEYVRLEDLTPADVGYNVARLRAEGRAKLRHADALEAWGRSRYAA
jgi:hypothetical protein